MGDVAVQERIRQKYSYLYAVARIIAYHLL